MEPNTLICLFLREYITADIFEQECAKDIENFEKTVESDIYEEILTTNFKNDEEIIFLKTKLKKYINRLDSSLFDVVNDSYIENLMEDNDEFIVRYLSNFYKPLGVVVLDLTNIISVKDLHRIFKTKLRFPSFYGENWDAFWDSINDIELPEKMVFYGWNYFEEKFPRDANILFGTLEELFVEIVWDDYTLICRRSYGV